MVEVLFVIYLNDLVIEDSLLVLDFGFGNVVVVE